MQTPKKHRYRINAILLLATLFTILAANVHAEEITNYKSGISLTWLGEEGVDYKEEYFYYDKIISDRKVVYIKETTLIEATHNNRNKAGSAGGSDRYESVDETVGTIRYKVDGDHRWSIYPNEYLEFARPISFKEMDYALYGEAQTKVVGSVGDNGVELSLNTKTSRFHKGIIDSYGDEWHTITVLDDDRGHAGSKEFQSSDGKIFYFVVNPKTPALTVTPVGDGQFYTTPPKKYFTPIIYDQTTYVSTGSNGTVLLELCDINGNSVYYKINNEAFIKGGNKVVIDASLLKNGINTLQYYYEGNEEYTKSRVIVKNPSHPSLNEQHGDRLWAGPKNWKNEVAPRLTSAQSWWINQWRSKNQWSKRDIITANSRKGYRNAFNWAGLPNAIIGRLDGPNAKPSGSTSTFYDYAKLALFETPLTIDPVGAELNTSETANPSRELIYRGYYDMNAIVDSAATYDVIAGYYRTDQGHKNGLSPIQDYFIRDTLASWVHISAMIDIAGFDDPLWDAYDSGGMWDTARKIGVATIASMLPSYTTPFYGTSGFDGNTETHKWNPFRDSKYTWKQMFFENNLDLLDFPNANRRFGLEEYNFTENGDFVDRKGYTSTLLMGHAISIYGNLLKLFAPEVETPRLDKFLEKASNGSLYGMKINTESDKEPIFRAFAALQNGWYPEFRANAQPRMLAKTKDSQEALGKQLSEGGPLYVLWYDHNLSPGPTSIPSIPLVSFEPNSSSLLPNTEITLSSSTPGASIYYTIDGSDPDTNALPYTGSIAILESSTIKAYAQKDGFNDSPIAIATYTVINPMLDPPSSSLQSGVYSNPLDIALGSAETPTTIYYTTDDSEPTTSSNRYSSPIRIEKTTTIKAFSHDPNRKDSETIYYEYRLKTSDPEFSLSNTFFSNAEIEISSTTQGSVIHYTTDGSVPSTSSPVFKSNIQVFQPTNFKAKAFYNEFEPSEATEFSYQPEELTTSNGWLNTAIDPQSGQLVFSFVFVPSADAIDTVVALGTVESPSFYSELNVLVRFAADGTIDAYNGTRKPDPWYDSVQTLKYSLGEAYRVNMKIDTDAMVYSVTISNDGKTQNEIARNFGFRSPPNTATGLTNLSIITNSDQGGVLSEMLLGTIDILPNTPGTLNASKSDKPPTISQP